MKIKKIILLGDIFTSRVGQNMFCLHAFFKYVRKFKEEDISLYMIPGNHDKMDQNITNSYLDMFSNHHNVHLFDEEGIEKYDDNINFCFMPYFKDNEIYLQRLHKLINEIKGNGKSNFLFTHASFNGATNNDFSVVKNNLSPLLFSALTKVFSGHYHEGQHVGRNIWYIPAAYAHNFGESNHKGFTVLYSDGSTYFIHAKFPLYVTMRFDLSKDKLMKIEEQRKIYSNFKNNVRFIFVGTEEQLISIEKQRFEEVGIIVDKKPLNILKSVNLAKEGKMIEFNKLIIQKYFIQYCAYNGIKGKDKELGKHYIEQI